MKLPNLYPVRQTFPRPRVSSIDTAVREELDKLGVKHRLPKGAKVGVTAGSRGIGNIVEILRTTVNYLKEHGFYPAIIAAMGSHGGGTADGQLKILHSLGISEESLGVPIRVGVDVVEVGKTTKGLSAYIRKHVFDMDGVIVINRVKTHTALVGNLQSGLIKACVVGLGGPKGAQQFHSLGTKELPGCLREIGTLLVENGPIIGGLAIVENGYDETAYIIGVEARRFIEEEPRIYETAAELMPQLPIDRLDVLVVEEMGKNFSGSDIDNNVVGRFRVLGDPEPEKPFIKRVVILDLSKESHGNANGLGLADFVTDKLLSQMDLKATYLNVLTSLFVQRCFIPLHFPSEKETIEMAIASLGHVIDDQLRLLIVSNTLHLEHLYASKALLPELKVRPGVEIADHCLAWEFDSNLEMIHKLSERVLSTTT